MMKSTKPQQLLTKAELRGRMSGAVFAFVVGIVGLLIKFWAHNVTGSQAIYSDAVESIVNVVTAIVGILVVYYASQPADDDHPYGHGKVEYFSSAFEGGMITIAALFVFVEATKAQLENAPLQNLDRGTLLIAAAGILNLTAGWFLTMIGRKNNSLTLIATGTHLIVDFWTTVGAVVGVFAVRVSGIVWIDRLVAIVLGLHMAASGLRLVRQSFTGLLDAEDIKILSRLAEIFEKHAGQGIIQIHHAKVIRSGWFHHIDAHVVVPEFWTVEQAHDRLNQFEEKVLHTYEYSGEANFHVDPCEKKYCAVCDYNPCNVRVKAFERRLPVVLEHLRSKTEPPVEH